MRQIHTDQIKVGDRLHHHGIIFEITALNRSDTDEYGVWYNYATKVIADNSNGFFPKGWLNDYSIQGNHNARWLLA